MRPLRFWAALLLVLLVTGTALAQQPDADGDGIPDSDDFCWLQPGTADFHGCTAENFPDYDGDGVGDPVDTCVDQAGLAENSGCPAGVIPDLDLDGIPDSADACPREPGKPELQGCPRTPTATASRITPMLAPTRLEMARTSAAPGCYPAGSGR